MSRRHTQIKCQAAPVVSYAMAQNAIRLVDRLQLSGGVETPTTALLTLEVKDSDGVLSQPFERFVELSPAGATVLTDLPLLLDAGQMLQLEEQRREAVLVVKVVVDGEVLGEHQQPVRVLSPYQWLNRPHLLSMELLAAFVMPNDPAVRDLVAEASVLLRQRTGSSSLEGYQSGPERVDDIARAVYEAMQARQVRYSEPPASWADQGQKVRTPDEVLNGRTGTCLDTTVVMAAALEQTGIRPLIWLLDGHAFLGYWREELGLDSIVQTEIEELVNYLDLGHMQVVETTCLTEQPEPVPFDEAQRSAYRKRLSGDLASVLGVVDVRSARRTGLVPLPARRRTLTGVEVVEYRPVEHSSPPPVAVTGRQQVARPTDVPPRVQAWKNALLDLSLRNRLINMTKSSGIALTVPEGSLARLEDLVNADTPLTLLPADQVDGLHTARGLMTGAELPQAEVQEQLERKKALWTDVPAGRYATRFRNLAYKARTVREETGANNLYLALGTLVWEQDGKPLRSPLILVPMTLKAANKGQTYRMAMDESGASTPNYCLLEKLSQVHGLEIPGLANPVADQSGIDLDAALRAVREAIAGARLPYRVESTATLGILQFAKFRLWKDLDEQWRTMLGNPLVDHLVHRPLETFVDPVASAPTVDLDALEARCPVAADASQLHAVAEAVQGRTFVLEGPPGTGKSQTITNLLSRAVADGKTVLFVAEKRAALDVVKSRLTEVGMGAFCLDLHDKSSKPLMVRGQLTEALDHTVRVDAQELKKDLDDLAAVRKILSRYAERLHATNPVKLSVYSSHTQVLTLGPGPELAVPPAALAPGTAVEVTAALADLEELTEAALPAHGHPWGFVQQPVDVDVLQAASVKLDDAILSLSRDGLLGILELAGDSADFDTVKQLISFFLPLDLLDQTRSPSWQQAADTLLADAATDCSGPHPCLGYVTADFLDLPLESIHAAAESATGSRAFGRRKRVAAVLDQLRPALRADVEVQPDHLVRLTGDLLARQRSVVALRTRAEQLQGLQLPDAWDPHRPRDRELAQKELAWLHWAGTAIDPSAGSPFVQALRQHLNALREADPDAAERVDRLFHALTGVQSAAGDENGWVSWVGDARPLPTWQERRAGTIPSLAAWAALVDALEPLRAAGLDEARASLLSGDVNAEDAVRAFERGLARASLEERRAAGALTAFSPAKQERSVERYLQSSDAVRRHLVDALPEEVMTARPFRADAPGGRVGALRRELSRTRGGLSVRALLEEYADLVTQLLPCVLVSPDSVSRFFPVRAGLFDLVVFDEASQIRVPDAVGAMGRGTSIVVVGDSKQMPPTSFGDAGLDDLDEGAGPSTVVDEESILTECVQARVAQRLLTWHYRSADESLIAFSNERYYDGRLASFPAPTHGVADGGIGGYGISLRRVDGVFHRDAGSGPLRTNPIEALAVVAEVRSRFAASPDVLPSIGIVTFNQPQRAYIETLLRDSGDERLVEALDADRVEGLFLKNLENVQGDERDVVLFSTAFSVKPDGELPLNFGPLNRGGGERRLNVAITRARRQVIVFCSFDPEQLRAERSTSVGIRHLRAYLDLAAGIAVSQAAVRVARMPDRHVRAVQDALVARGLHVQTEVGLSDFRIDLSVARADAPERPVLAVLLDGPAWASRETVGDRDGLPARVLTGLMGWPAVRRVWLPAWLDDPVGVVDGLVAAVDGAPRPVGRGPVVSTADGSVGLRGGTRARRHEAPQPAPAEAAPVSAPVRSLLAASAPVLRPAVHPVLPPPRTGLLNEETFVPWTTSLYGDVSTLDRLPDRRAAEQVRRVLESVVEAEGPVHLDRLCRLVANSFGLNQVRAARADAIRRLVPSDLRRDRSEDFAWPRSLDLAGWRTFRREPAEVTRGLSEVSRRELVNAMASICSASAGASRDELLREVGKVFGVQRLASAKSAQLSSALDQAVSDGRLMERQGFFHPVDGS